MKNIIINFTYRSKFEKLITNDADRQTFNAAFNKFFALTPEKASHFLWRLTYDEKVALKALAEIDLDSEKVSSEMILPIRNELRYQYKQLHSKFLEMDGIPEECQTAFNALLKSTDDIVANVVYHHCTYRLDEHELYMNNLFAQLSSDKDNKYFGGIRSLYFGWLEANYLKPLHSQIHDLLKEMYTHHQKQFVAQPMNTPFAELDKMLQEKGYVYPFVMGPNEVVAETTAEVPAEVQEELPTQSDEKATVQDNSVFKAITFENILAHKDVFSAFVINRDMNALCELCNIGFDLNLVVTKADAISSLLDAIKAKEEADEILVKATQLKKESEENLLKATEALS